MTALGEERAQRLRARLVDAGQIMCRSEALMRHWAAAAPELVGAVDQTTALSEAIDVIAAGGGLTVPTGRSSWDRSFSPALPRFVVVKGIGQARRERAWRTLPWRGELGWVASLRVLTDANLAHLLAINDWLAATRGGRVPVVPQRIRSAEVLGDEKALDNLSRSKLFGEGRLSWELLAATPLAPPLAVRQVGGGGAVLVVENSDPYWLACEALAGHAGPVGLVAWGQGRGGVHSLPTLALEPGVTGPVWYWGDIDPAGLDIPSAASPAVAATGLGPMLPAVPLYEAMADHLDQAGPTPGREVWDRKDHTAWLGPQLWARFREVVESGGRVAQEVVGPDQVIAAVQKLR